MPGLPSADRYRENVIVELLRRIADALFDQQNFFWFVGGAVASAATLAIKWWQGRKVLYYEEDYNSKIGFHSPFGDGSNALLKNFNNVSVMVLHVWNGGRATIDSGDFRTPLTFEVDDRFILDFRRSGPKPAEVASKEHVEKRWRASSKDHENPHDPDTEDEEEVHSQSDLRATLPESLGGLDEEKRRTRKKLTIPMPKDVALKPGDGFKVVVCLREDKDLGTGSETTKDDYRFDGDLRSGKIVQKNGGRRWRPTITQVAGVALVGCLAAVLVVAVGPRPPEFCTDGDLELLGSSAFSSMVRYAADGYVRECTSTRIASDMTGSLDGVRGLAHATGPVIAFSDGAAVEGEGLERDPVAVLTFHVVLNTSVGLDDLSPGQLRDINAGHVTNWRQLGGPDLPVRIVGRGADSGSRLAYERYVLGTGEAPVSSTSCREQDRGFQAPATRCERQTTREVLETVDETPGAIGYADAADVGGYSGLRPILIGGVQGVEAFLEAGYEFWTIEYAYRRDQVAGSLEENFLGYLQRDSVARAMREEGYIPCRRSDGSVERICQAVR
jgi:phosphate transport system substrate-binding protein